MKEWHQTSEAGMRHLGSTATAGITDYIVNQTQLTGGCVGPKTGIDDVKRRKILSLLGL
jgi:hypothetical protein